MVDGTKVHRTLIISFRCTVHSEQICLGPKTTLFIPPIFMIFFFALLLFLFFSSFYCAHSPIILACRRARRQATRTNLAALRTQTNESIFLTFESIGINKL